MKSIISTLAILTAFTASAEIRETMNVNLADGTTVTYNVKDVTNVTFESKEIREAFTITPAGGEKVIYETIPTMLRVVPGEEASSIEFGFGTVEAATGADLVAGEYGVWLRISPTKFGVADLNLAENPDSYLLTVMKYQDGQVAETYEKVTEGTMTTAINQKTKVVTLKLSATFEDGTLVTADYTGVPTTIETLDGIVPTKQYGNEVIVLNGDGSEMSHYMVSYVRASVSSYSGKTTLKGYDEFDDEVFRVVTDNTVINQGKFNITEIEGDAALTIIHKDIQVTSPETSGYRNVVNNGTASVELDSNNEYHVLIEFDNYYSNSYGENLGDGRHVIISFNGAAK